LPLLAVAAEPSPPYKSKYVNAPLPASVPLPLLVSLLLALLLLLLPLLLRVRSLKELGSLEPPHAARLGATRAPREKGSAVRLEPTRAAGHGT
jgi:hypothetical protein